MVSSSCYTSAQFIQECTIEFERKTNQWKKMEAQGGDEENESNWLEYIKKSTPQYKVDKFSFVVKNNVTCYTPIGEVDEKGNGWFNDNVADKNSVYCNYNTNITTAFKSIFEDDYLITDSIKSIAWRITDETRNVGGFKCRKAIGKYCDSVTVIAFYTDQIMVTGGPESFNGLPGCILGVAIPRLHTTWFASSINVATVKQEALAPPKSGKKINNAQLDAKLKSSVGKWGKWGERYIHSIKL